MAGRTACVTGATGFIGRNLVDELLAAGWEVAALHRPGSATSGLASLPVTLVEGDVTDAGSLLRAIPQGVDAVFHVAANTSMWGLRRAELERVNVGGTRNVVAAALERGARRLVHTSSVAAFGFRGGTVDESYPLDGERSWIDYFRTKALGEREVEAGMARGLDAVILNPAHVVGRYDRGNWSRVVVMVAEDRLPGVPPGAGSFAHGREVARAQVAAAERGASGARYILGGTDATFLELVQCIGEIVGRRVPSRATPGAVLRVLGRLSLWWSYLTRREPDLTPEGVAIVTRRIRYSSDKAMAELGYRAVPLEVMVEDCYRWLVEEGLVRRR